MGMVGAMSTVNIVNKAVKTNKRDAREAKNERLIKLAHMGSVLSGPLTADVAAHNKGARAALEAVAAFISNSKEEEMRLLVIISQKRGL
jgi:hypothetical protein